VNRNVNKNVKESDSKNESVKGLQAKDFLEKRSKGLKAKDQKEWDQRSSLLVLNLRPRVN
jgi:hypothetical protein